MWGRLTACGGLSGRLALAAAALALAGAPAHITPTDAERAVLDRISAQSLEGHLSFIASDLLEGRATPSRGLDIAAEYIAAQFRRAGLDPAGTDGYFQMATAKNVVGVLRGSDPRLRDTCVVLSAHYDHLGVRGDKIYNGANDDGSGTVSVIEIASALATLSPHPKRTIVFAAFFGEERGQLGSQYFVRHPVCPGDATVVDLNLEQLGRTDSTEGPRIASAALTGFDFTGISRVMKDAGEATGIRIYNDPRYGDAFFRASDNASFADAGIPSTTLAVTFLFPDYHRPGDKWPKIDYANMAKVDRAIALGLLLLASDAEPPHWNTANPKAARYAGASADHTSPAVPAK
ncbi:MAG: M28 family peptidase [Bryobacteraceae bacterium]|jgi:Zn-dependent M28 family amino/carboxypeptidase